MHSAVRIGLIGDFNPQQKAHTAIPKALAAVSDGVECAWISTESAGNREPLAEYNGLWCAPGMPYRDENGVLRAIRYARESGTPFLGTSAGFQYAIIEFARNTLGLSTAGHQKSDPATKLPLMTPLNCALLGVRSRVRYTRGSMLHRIYQADDSIEEYHCSYGFNGRYSRLLEARDLTIAAVDDHNDIRAVELEGHPFFIATLFQPEMRPPGEPNPLVAAFVAVAARRARAVSRAVG
jgi:CTP synthase (UTP-ammonia lyase)